MGADRRGGAAVQSIFADTFEWIFGEQHASDFGIDTQVEIVRDHEPTGQLIALQINCGPSYFRKHGENFVFCRRGAALLTGRSPPYWIGGHETGRDQAPSA